jgi:hypothetical protein
MRAPWTLALPLALFSALAGACSSETNPAPTAPLESDCSNTCGGDCECPAGLTCTQSGICKCDSSCTPNCDGKSCGDDGCGGTCGKCDSGSVCSFDGAMAMPWSCQPFGGTDAGMTFFVTSRGTYEDGGNLGGLEGADGICDKLASDAGVTGKTWRAYLSTGDTAARDRIGAGPWNNARGEAIVDCEAGACIDALHTNGLPTERALTELGTQIDWANAHDIFTGSNADGSPSGADCAGWTSNGSGDMATMGHVNEPGSWVSSHPTGCDRVSMQCTAGQGHLYCFAIQP